MVTAGVAGVSATTGAAASGLGVSTDIATLPPLATAGVEGAGVAGAGASTLALTAPAASLKHLEHMYPVCADLYEPCGSACQPLDTCSTSQPLRIRTSHSPEKATALHALAGVGLDVLLLRVVRHRS